MFVNHVPVCPSCGSATKRAFPLSTAYVTCTQGHVNPNTQED